MVNLLFENPIQIVHILVFFYNKLKIEMIIMPTKFVKMEGKIYFLSHPSHIHNFVIQLCSLEGWERHLGHYFMKIQMYPQKVPPSKNQWENFYPFIFQMEKFCSNRTSGALNLLVLFIFFMKIKKGIFIFKPNLFVYFHKLPCKMQMHLLLEIKTKMT